MMNVTTVEYDRFENDRIRPNKIDRWLDRSIEGYMDRGLFDKRCADQTIDRECMYDG